MRCSSVFLIVVCPMVAPNATNAQQTGGPSAPPIDLATHPIGGFGLDLAARDPAVKPGDDFFMSVNGTWYAKAVIPPTFTAAGAWFELRIKSVWREQAILEAAAANGRASASSPERKIGAFYRAFMNDAKAESLGLTPLRPALRAIQAARTTGQLARLMGQIAGPGTVRAINTIGPPPGRGVFSVDVGQDPEKPTRHATFLGTPGVLLPAPSFYVDPKLADIKQAYEAHLARVLGLIGWPTPEESASGIVAFETRVAGVLTFEATRTGSGKAERATLAELERAAPQFDWHAYLVGAELGQVKTVWLDSWDVTKKVAAIVAETPVSVLQARLAFATAAARAQSLDKAMRQADFEFRTLTTGKGAVPPPRSRVAALAIEANMGEAIGALYVRQYTSPAAKAQGTDMAANLRAAMSARIDKAEWLSAATKAKAHAKLDRIIVKVGYPDHFEDYGDLAISDIDLYGDMVRGAEYSWRRLTRELERPVDRADWRQTFPQTVNTVANAPTNDVVYPAGLLQPPFLDPNADAAVNYGGVGAFMASSIASLLNDYHRDADGREVEWFTPDETATFRREAQKLSAQYSGFEPLPGLHINGEQTLSGSLYDLGGLVVALEAYHRSLGGKPAPVIEGLTGDQRFFMSWAQFWRLRFRPEFIRNQVATDPNSPAIQRANGPERNMDEWYAAFNVQPGEKLFVAPENRVRIW